MSELFPVFEAYKLKIVLLLSMSFIFASVLGYCAHRIKISPILGFLVAGYLLGPFSPGFVADLQTAEQLAEIGVILMMFGVGLDFKIEDLVSVKMIAIPGAIGQTAICALLCGALIYGLGWPLKQGIIIGLAVGVASTVVLVRMLQENNILKTKEGHIAVGWLIVEDLITVIILLFLPIIAQDNASLGDFIWSGSMIIVKFLILAFILLVWARKGAAYLLSKVLATGSNELFTLSMLGLVFGIAVGATVLFGISIALGAFLAGMVVGQTEVQEKALKHSLALKDVFVAVFFISVGMLFNPEVILSGFPIFISILAVILIGKPIIAIIITLWLKYPMKTALVVAVALAQIGEFSFILMEEALKLHLMPDEGFDLVVACAMVAIGINPFLFRLLKR